MNSLTPSHARARRFAFGAVAAFAALLILGQTLRAAVWKGIEPLKSRRAEVERALGRPLQDQPGATATLRFKVAGGTVKVSFVTAKFVETKKLLPELEGTVLQVVLQHERGTETPDSLGITGNSRFKREEKGDVTVFRNAKDGIVYTFVRGRLVTTYYTPSAEQWARVQTKG
jgi:hypothetical protein